MGKYGVERSQKKLLLFGIYCAAIVLGTYMTFFYKEQTETGENRMQYDAADYAGKELPAVENESDEGNGKDLLYFTNTAKLDAGRMPFRAQGILVEETQRFLRLNGYEDVTELYVYAESYLENEKKVSFCCFMDGHKEALQIEFLFEEERLKFYILPDGADTGEENE